MRKIVFALAALGLVSGGAATLSAKPRLTGEERLAKMLEGRAPGKPQSCISQFDTRDLTVLDKTALVYKAGGTIWVNRPKNADDLDDDDVLVTRLTGSQFCRLDIVHTQDRVSHFTTGFISLGDFVPYRKVG